MAKHVDSKVALRAVISRFSRIADNATDIDAKAKALATVRNAQDKLNAIVAREIDYTARGHKAAATRLANQAKRARGSNRAKLLEAVAHHQSMASAVLEIAA